MSEGEGESESESESESILLLLPSVIPEIFYRESRGFYRGWIFVLW